MTDDTAVADSKVAVVLCGAAARGAFQAGALAEVLPALAASGADPSILFGTSAGAINVALAGSTAHLPAADRARHLEDVWDRMSHADVYRPILRGSLRTGLRFVSGALFGIGSGTTSLLDTAPLRARADEVLDMRRLHHNVAEGVLDAVGVVTTRIPPAAADTHAGTSSGRTVIFLDEHQPSDFHGDEDRAQSVHRGPIGAEHVVASAAIPIVFPPQRITQPGAAAGWHVDGGVRLNAPLGPAIALGATKLVVISATATEHSPELPPDLATKAPDAADAGAQALNALLADRLVEDLLALRRMNRLIADAEGASPGAPPRRRNGTPYETIHVTTVSPPPHELGRVADRIFDKKTSGFGAFRESDNWLLGRMLRGAGDATGRRELLSYLLFDEDYFAASFDLGRKAAKVALAAGWQT